MILGNNNSKPTILLMSDFKLEQWNNITKTFFATYTKEKTSGYEWKFGYSDYTKVGTPLGFGTLTIDATGKTQMLSYDSKDDKLISSPKSVTLNESLLMSAQAYTKLLIERTNDKQILNFRETLSNVAASASIVVGFGGTLASGSSFGARALSMSGTIFSSDDMTGSFGGGTFLEKIGTPSTLLNVVKPMVSVLSFGKQLDTGLGLTNQLFSKTDGFTLVIDGSTLMYNRSNEMGTEKQEGENQKSTPPIEYIRVNEVLDK